MNAILSLCHFCELHGPSVVFCTQAFRDLPDISVLCDMEAVDILDRRPITAENEKSGETNLWKYGSVHQDHYTNMNITGNDACVACRSFQHNQPGFISNDDAARVSYVSSQFPLQSELYVPVRHACIRSLSCEVCPGREGPIYFGDEARGHVLSHTFFLRDVQARGFQRWYSILVLMKDKMLLLNSWPFIVRHLRQTIDRLQENANKVYEAEESKVSHRALRSATMMSDNFRRQRAVGQPRSLPQLAGDEGVWQYLHSSFSWLMKAGGLRLQERLVEGPPVNAFVANDEADGIGINIRELYNALGAAAFHTVARSLLIGHQVVFRGPAEGVVAGVVRSLKPLLPKHCYKAVEFSSQYADRSTCNILGLHSLAEVPKSALENDNLCLVEMVPREEGPERDEVATAAAAKLGGTVAAGMAPKDADGSPRACNSPEESEAAQVLKKISFQISKEGFLCQRPPQVLSRIESAVGNNTLTPAAMMIYLTTIIYEWINKVKVWVHVQNKRAMSSKHLEGMPPPGSVIHPQGRGPTLPVLRSPSHTAGKAVASPNFRSLSPAGTTGSPASLETTQHDELHQLLAAIGSAEWDVPLLEFWAKNFQT
ncbi:folliculin [Penaeus vannamei]|uniref:folliculin n=1 Tax=Penaeus vannamei TaxID=6689 RepID=UPI00387F69BA